MERLWAYASAVKDQPSEDTTVREGQGLMQRDETSSQGMTKHTTSSPGPAHQCRDEQSGPDEHSRTSTSRMRRMVFGRRAFQDWRAKDERSRDVLILSEYMYSMQIR